MGIVLTQLDAQIPDAYDGREQALIKHRLLESYLQKLFMIVGTGGRGKSVELCYVDCFAGPWQVETESLDGTSIAISMKTLDACRQKLGSMSISAKIRALYIEKDIEAYGRLDRYLRSATPSGITTASLQGDFVDLRDQILDWCGKTAFVFFFIDPKGWKEIGVETLRKVLARTRSEFLINFAYMFVNRTISAADWQARMFELLGQAIDLEGCEPEEREHRIVDAYRTSLKQCLPGTDKERSAYVRVLDPMRNRPKYHLVYLTSHPRGIIEFMTISESVDLVQKQVRAVKKSQQRAQQSGMDDMFGDDVVVNETEGRAEPDDVDRFWLDYLARGMKRVGESEFADLLERTNWFPGDLQASLVRLIAVGRVVNLDAPKKRPKMPLHWKDNERLQLSGAAQ